MTEKPAEPVSPESLDERAERLDRAALAKAYEAYPAGLRGGIRDAIATYLASLPEQGPPPFNSQVGDRWMVLLRLILEDMPAATNRDLAADGAVGDSERKVWAAIETQAQKIADALAQRPSSEQGPSLDEWLRHWIDAKLSEATTERDLASGASEAFFNGRIRVLLELLEALVEQRKESGG